MKSLKELSYILTKSKTRSIEIIGDESMSRNSKLNQLYNAVKNGEVETDEEAAFLIYGEKVQSNKYRNLKSNLKKRLFNTVFHIDMNETLSSDQEKAYFNCWRQWSSCMIIWGKSGIHTATKICKGENISTIDLLYSYNGWSKEKMSRNVFSQRIKGNFNIKTVKLNGRMLSCLIDRTWLSDFSQ